MRRWQLGGVIGVVAVLIVLSSVPGAEIPVARAALSQACTDANDASLDGANSGVLNNYGASSINAGEVFVLRATAPTNGGTTFQFYLVIDGVVGTYTAPIPGTVVYVAQNAVSASALSIGEGATTAGGGTAGAAFDMSCQASGPVTPVLPGPVYVYGPGSTTITVPAAINLVVMDVAGAEGGSDSSGGSGRGGRAVAAVPATGSLAPGSILQVNVGGRGAGGTGGFNGGGNGGPGGFNRSRGGGGASDLRTGAFTLAQRVIVGGGGGGQGGFNGGGGGGGGGLTGGAGGASFEAAPGEGGTSSSGGAGGGNGTAGALGTGGPGGAGNSFDDGGGGGGGGYYGGGGGSSGISGGGGGGGSGFGPAGVQFSSGVQSGDGLVILNFVNDTTAPTITFSGFTGSSTSGSVSATDSQSGVVSLSCTDSLGGLTQGTLVLSGSPPSGSRTLSVSGPGTHVISCTATDAVGNTTNPAVTTTVMADATPPAVAITGFSGQNTSGTVTATDSGSGVASISCTDSANGLTLGTITGASGDSSRGRSITLTGEGTHLLSCTATDVAGNTTSPAVMQTVLVDTTAPAVTITGFTGLTPHGGTATATDGGSGIATIDCTDSVSGGLTQGALSGAAASSPRGRSLVVSGAGTHSLSCTATDTAGNTTTPAVTTSVVITTGGFTLTSMPGVPAPAAQSIRSPLVWDIALINAGAALVAGASVTFTLPSGLQHVSAQVLDATLTPVPAVGGQPSCVASLGNTRVVCTLGALPAGGAVVIRLTEKVVRLPGLAPVCISGQAQGNRSGTAAFAQSQICLPVKP